MKLRNEILIFTILGLLYMDMEMAARMMRGELIGYLGLSKYSLAGWTSLWMFFIAGALGSGA